MTPYGILSCITHRPLPIYQISFKSKKLFVDGRTYGRTDIFPPILLGRLLEVDLKTSDGATGPNKKFDNIISHVDTIHQCDSQKNRWTLDDSKDRA